jgi:hypothetical protein
MKLYEVRYEDGRQKRIWFASPYLALLFKKRLAEELGMKIWVYPVMYPRNPYKKIFKK